jgi:hypothetical protein
VCYNIPGISNEVNNMALIRKSEYACKLGVSRSYVSKLAKQDKIALWNGLIDEDKMNTRADLKKQLLEAKLKNEIFKGQILKAKTDALEREYVSAEDVKKAVQAKNRIIRDTLLQICRGYVRLSILFHTGQKKEACSTLAYLRMWKY